MQYLVAVQALNLLALGRYFAELAQSGACAVTILVFAVKD